jgi:hypothetical protein
MMPSGARLDQTCRNEGKAKEREKRKFPWRGTNETAGTPERGGKMGQGEEKGNITEKEKILGG